MHSPLIVSFISLIAIKIFLYYMPLVYLFTFKSKTLRSNITNFLGSSKYHD